jgi:membrane protease YdiL (CAAX protease family)
LNPAAHPRWFWLGCLGELALGGLAFLLSAWTGQSLPSAIQWRWPDAFLGVAASLPLLLVFRIMLTSSLKALARIRLVLESVVRPVFGRWTLAQLAAISFIAGVGEELLFRGAIQGALTPAWGPVPAVVASSLLFGLCHALTLAYVVIASLIGALMSALWLGSGNLLSPIVAHAVYDFAALVYFLRVHKPVTP